MTLRIDSKKTALTAMYQLSMIAEQEPDKTDALMDMSLGIVFLFGYIDLGVQVHGQMQSIADIIDRGLEILGIPKEGVALV